MVNRGYVGEESRMSQQNILVLVDTAIIATNERLNINGKSRALVDRKTKRIYIRGTLPTMPDDGETPTKRYWIPFTDATLSGVAEAEIKCREIDSYLNAGGKEWWSLLPEFQEKKSEASKPKPASILKIEFENSYWLSREKTRKTLNTWEKSYSDIFLKIPDDDLLTETNIFKWIEKTQPNSKPRHDLIRVVKCLADHIGIKDEIDWKKFKCRYKPNKRSLPTDGYIEATFDNMAPDVGWSFGMIATYGLRPSELFQLTDGELAQFTDPSNKRHILYVPEDTKTGEREVYPLHPEWVERFDLKNVFRIKTSSSKLEYKISWLNKLFHKAGFNQPAYDLRHRYAIRATELEIPVDIASKWMGHSLEEHAKTYQKWMSITTFNKAFDKMMEGKGEASELKRLRLENAWLREEIERLKALIK
ncbi:hypothetical protein [Scytonema sp. NUACC26]|uniref:hypothetical protein n=1 Tax=Scytonema sp. NUACC26 TaxID=3140176 RepID=UPI0034DBD7C6